MRVDVIRDRGSLGREVAGGMIENVYRLQILNSSESPLVLSISAQGIEGLRVGVGRSGAQSADRIEVPAASNYMMPVVVQAPYDGAIEPGSHPIEFVTVSREMDSSNGAVTEVREPSSFIFPR